jgi:hypothetical protein
VPPAAVAGPALRLDLRDRARVDARLREEPLDERGRVGAVGVDDHDSEPRARADAHAVLVAEIGDGALAASPSPGPDHWQSGTGTGTVPDCRRVPSSRT